MEREVIVFIAIVLGIAAFMYSLFAFGAQAQLLLLAVAFIAFVAVARSNMLLKLEAYEKAVVLRFGRIVRVSGPGWILILPVVERPVVYDMRVQVVDIPPQSVITKGNIQLRMNIAIYLRIIDPAKVHLNVRDMRNAAAIIIESQLRNIIGKMLLDEVIGSLETINAFLHSAMQKVSDDFGIETLRVEVQGIELPEDVSKAMHQKRVAEEHKLIAEQRAIAQEMMIDIVDKAARKMSDPTLTFLYLDALKRVADGKSTKIIFPMEFSRLAERLAGKGGKNYESIVGELIGAYQEKVREIEEKKAEKKGGK